MTRRERLEAKIEKRRKWAVGAERQADREHNLSHNLVKDIPFGQPILVGHHSEGRHRRTLDRSWNALGRAIEATRRAENHLSKANNLEASLERTIFSDDPDAIENLEAKLVDLEASRERMKMVNKLYRKADVEGLKAIGVDYEMLKTKLAEMGSYFGSAPHLPYELQNIGGRIQDAKRRIETVTARQKRTAKAEAAGGMTIERTLCGTTNYATVTFAEKPERTILNDLRNAGFRWGGGNWFGEADKLPASVVELETKPEVMA
jgi:DNA repair exonuclease SbcCD ATPase subunit